MKPNPLTLHKRSWGASGCPDRPNPSRLPFPGCWRGSPGCAPTQPRGGPWGSHSSQGGPWGSHSSQGDTGLFSCSGPPPAGDTRWAPGCAGRLARAPTSQDSQRDRGPGSPGTASGSFGMKLRPQTALQSRSSVRGLRVLGKTPRANAARADFGHFAPCPPLFAGAGSSCLCELSCVPIC